MITRMMQVFDIQGCPAEISLESSRIYSAKEIKEIINQAFDARRLAHRDQFLRSKKIRILELNWRQCCDE